MTNETRQRVFALWVLFGINAMNFYDRQILAAVTEPIRKEWGLSDTAIGTLGTAFTLIYAAVGLPLGRLADSWSRNQLLSIGVGVWSLLTAASGLAGNFAWLFVESVGRGRGRSELRARGEFIDRRSVPAAQTRRGAVDFHARPARSAFF